jgi:16S rRNA G966 N2-methylase RsmD|tara:strand:+ start:764 stop:1294 length:531 start_codon:yes stop_codon:yes gene_type:complete
MDISFNEIKKEYDTFYQNLLSRGKLPLRSTGQGFWGHVPAADIFEAFKKLELHKHRTFVDLGSGDGKVVLIASLFCKRAVGIEMDNKLFKKSLEIQKNLGIKNTVFFNNDFYEHSVNGFDAVFTYPDEPMHRGLEKKLLNELTGKLIHCGHHFHPENMIKQSEVMVNGTRMTIYTK